MRKLIYEAWVSLDGYAEDKDGKLDFFPSMEANREADLEQLEFLESIDLMLLARKSYEMFVDYWPTENSTGEVIADKLNALPKAIFSNTLDNAPWGNYPDAQVLSGNALDHIRRLTQQDGKNIVLWGSISLAQELIKNNLIDEMRLHICPSVIGGGRALFPQTSDYKDFTPTRVKSYNTGVVSVFYEPKI